MKLVFKTKSAVAKEPIEKTYFVRLPNYFDSDRESELVDDIAVNCLGREQIAEHYLMGDSHITNDERKQLDIYGEIVSPLIELKYDNLQTFLKR